jgi:hypothetical protein
MDLICIFLLRVMKVDLLKFLMDNILFKINVCVVFKFIDNFTLSANLLLQYLISRLDLLYVPREIVPRLLARLFPDDYNLARNYKTYRQFC